jgi:hypothetical protein
MTIRHKPSYRTTVSPRSSSIPSCYQGRRSTGSPRNFYLTTKTNANLLLPAIYMRLPWSYTRFVIPSLRGFYWTWFEHQPQVLTGAPPFANREKQDLACRVVLSGERPSRPSNSESLGITNEIWSLLETCWAKDAASRPNVNHVVRCLKGAVKDWDPATFLAGSKAGVQEGTGMDHERAQKFADELDKVCDRENVELVGISICFLRPLTPSASVARQRST